MTWKNLTGYGGALAGALLALLFCVFLVRPETGVCESFTEQAKMLHLTSRFNDFPAVGPTEWKRFDRLRNAYRVKGRVTDLQSYADWRFGMGAVDVRELGLDEQRDNPVIGNKGDRYLVDGFYDGDQHIEIRILDIGQFYFDISDSRYP